MDNLSIPMSLLPKGIIIPVAFLADKHPNLPYYGIDTGDLVIIDSGMEFVKGELSVFKRDEGNEYQLLKEVMPNQRHFGKVVMILKYFRGNPFV